MPTIREMGSHGAPNYSQAEIDTIAAGYLQRPVFITDMAPHLPATVNAGTVSYVDLRALQTPAWVPTDGDIARFSLVAWYDFGTTISSAAVHVGVRARNTGGVLGDITADSWTIAGAAGAAGTERYRILKLGFTALRIDDRWAVTDHRGSVTNTAGSTTYTTHAAEFAALDVVSTFQSPTHTDFELYINNTTATNLSINAGSAAGFLEVIRKPS